MVTRPMYKNNVSLIERKEKKYIKSSPHPSMHAVPLTKTSYANSPPNCDYSHNPKLLPLFIMSDKG